MRLDGSSPQGRNANSDALEPLKTNWRQSRGRPAPVVRWVRPSVQEDHSVELKAYFLPPAWKSNRSNKSLMAGLLIGT
jgi:hypothetical protein